MDRREIQKRMLASEAYWALDSNRACHDIGRVGCHDIEVKPSVAREIQPGEPYYVVSLDIETGSLSTTHFDGEGNQIAKDQAHE